MPYRSSMPRNQAFLLPPSLDDLVPADHPARFVAEFVAELDLAALGFELEAAVEGRPRYRPEHLLACWLYGFMTRVRSSRQSERACTESVALLWLTGFERPDHNTLWRFYQSKRPLMRELFRRTVHLAIDVELVDFALHAVDGTRIGASAAGRRTLNRAELQALLERVDAGIEALEAQNCDEAKAESPSWRLPQELKDRRRLRECLQEAMTRLDREAGRSTVNLTDLDARRMRTAHGRMTAYNGQAMADGQSGILVAMDVTTGGADTPQLLPMLGEAEAMTGRQAEELVADGGYYSGANVEAVQNLDLALYAPVQRPSNAGQQPAYYASQFSYNPETDTYTCPEGQVISYVYTSSSRGGSERRIYRGKTCGKCPVRSACTRNPRGRSIERMPWADAVDRHRAQMRTETARERMRRRRQLIEPVFGTIKEHLGLRRFLLRGLEGVRAEWLLTGCAYNLRKLYRYWWRPLRLRSLPAIG
jgi:transposase